MINIKNEESKVDNTRQRIHKNFDIDIVINNTSLNKETHNLKLDIFHTENLDGSDSRFDCLKIGKYGVVEGEFYQEPEDEFSGLVTSCFNDFYPKMKRDDIRTSKEENAIFEIITDYIQKTCSIGYL